MASAVLPSRNEPYWGERKVYMRKYANTSSNKPHFNNFNQTGPNRNRNPNPNSSPSLFHIPSRQIHDNNHSHPWKHDEQPSRPSLAAVAAAPAEAEAAESDSPYRKTNNHHREYLTFNLAAYSRAELRELERRLRTELEQVRSLRTQIENEEVKYRSGYLGSQFPARYGGGKAAPPRPPPLQVDLALESASVVLSREKITPKANQNNKKASNKRAIPFASGRDSKRHASTSDSEIGKLFTGTMKRCHQILVKLMKHKAGWVFNTPVDVVSLGLHDYHRIIKNPMDLGTVKSRLDKKQYTSPVDFASDVRLTFENAKTYNPKGSDVYIMAETLLSLFEKLFGPAYIKFEAQQRLVVSADQMQMAEPVEISAKELGSMPMQESSPNPPWIQVVGTPSSALKLPKPKARDPNKRQMSLEEKAKLGLGLQNLPSEKVDAMLEIIKKRNSHMTPQEDEIELDIEALDVETLWELERFVGYHKKAENKMKREGVSNTNKSSPVREQTPEAVTQKSKKGFDAGEEDVDIGEDIPVDIFPPVEIEKDDSCSSSSSSDSSSSSGSDSGSSSGSDSEEDSVQSPFVESKGGEAV